MATAIPLYASLPDPAEAARGRLRAAGVDPAAVPHAGAQTWEDYRREVGELAALGLEGDQLLDALAGPVVADPPELSALLANISTCATTR